MLYDNLPGIELTIQDRGLVLPAPEAQTARILIIAPISTSGIAGPYQSGEYNPVTINGQEDFENKGLGVYNADNPMACLWKQAYDAGCRDIQAIQLKGTTEAQRYGFLHDIFYILEENLSADIVLVGGVHADDTVSGTISFVYEREDYGASVASSNLLYTTLETPESLGTGDALKKDFTLTHSPVIPASLVLTKTVDAEVTQIPRADYTVDYFTGKVTFVEAPKEGEEIEATYNYYAASFASQVAGFCEIVSAKNTQILGVMALNPAGTTDLSLIKTYVDGQKTQKFSKFLQVVGGPELYFNIGSAVYKGMWAGAYAGLISVLPSFSSPMFKAIPGALFTAFNLSPSQITALINKHIVVPRVRNGRITVAEAITTADDTSDFVRLSTVRIVNDVINLVREISEPYIGEPNTLAKQNALDTSIRTGLQAMVNRGALNDFRFHIKSTIADQIDGTMRILLDVVPVFETRRILMSVAVKPML